MQSKATTPEQYIASLPDDRRDTLAAVRKVVLENLPQGYEEMMDYGMISYGIPLSTYSNTYNGHPLSIAALASQKNYYALYLMTVYGDPATKKWFEDAYKQSGKKLDMGKSCLRFKSLDDLPLDVIAQTIARVKPEEYIAFYEQSRATTTKSPAAKNIANKKAPAKKSAAKKAPAKKKSAKKSSAKKSAAKTSAKKSAKKTAKKSAKKKRADKRDAARRYARPAVA
jgi:hypothetical protein